MNTREPQVSRHAVVRDVEGILCPPGGHVMLFMRAAAAVRLWDPDAFASRDARLAGDRGAWRVVVFPEGSASRHDADLIDEARRRIVGLDPTTAERP